MKCITCNNTFTSKRSDAKFCSDTCRKKQAREAVRDNLSEIIVDESVRDKLPPNPPKYPKGFCHSCGKPEPEAWKGLMCICLECVNKGVTHTSLGLDKNAC